MVLLNFLPISLLSKIKASITVHHSNLTSNSTDNLQAPDSGFSPLLYGFSPHNGKI